jgi:TldD protein
MMNEALSGPSLALDLPNGTYFERFGIGREVLDKVLSAALSQGADDCDLYFEHSLSTSVALTDGKVNRATTGVDLGLGVRARKGDAVGYSYTEDLSLSAMLSAARTAAAIAAGGETRKPVDLKSLDLPNYYPIQRSWEAVGMEERLPLVRAWEAGAFAADPRIEKVQAYLMDSERVILIVRPDGRLVQDYQPMTLGYVVCTAQENGRRESGSYNVASRSGLEFYADPARNKRLVDNAVARSTFLLSAGKPPAGEMPIVLAPGASGILLHEAIGHGLEADFNRKGISIFSSQMNQKVAPDFVTVVDDGTVKSARGAVNTDDEGNATEKTVLVENGVLRNYMQDEISAAHYGVKPTGSGRRESFRHAPMPRMRATYMESGPHDPADIIRSVKKGIYCSSFSNGQVQIGAGDFAFYMRQGYLIEDGKLTQPIKDVNIIGNGPAALADVQMVGTDMELDEGGWTCGKDGQGVPVSQGQPTVKIGKLVVGGIG